MSEDSPKFGRRDFLKIAGLTAAGAFLSSCTPKEIIPTPEPKKSEPTIAPTVKPTETKLPTPEPSPTPFPTEAPKPTPTETPFFSENGPAQVVRFANPESSGGIGGTERPTPVDYFQQNKEKVVALGVQITEAIGKGELPKETKEENVFVIYNVQKEGQLAVDEVGAFVVAGKGNSADQQQVYLVNKNGVRLWSSKVSLYKDSFVGVTEDGQQRLEQKVGENTYQALFQMGRPGDDASGAVFEMTKLDAIGNPQKGVEKTLVLLLESYSNVDTQEGMILIVDGAIPLKIPNEKKVREGLTGMPDYYNGVWKIVDLKTEKTVVVYDPISGKLVEGKEEDIFEEIPGMKEAIELPGLKRVWNGKASRVDYLDSDGYAIAYWAEAHWEQNSKTGEWELEGLKGNILTSQKKEPEVKTKGYVEIQTPKYETIGRLTEHPQDLRYLDLKKHSGLFVDWKPETAGEKAIAVQKVPLPNLGNQGRISEAVVGTFLLYMEEVAPGTPFRAPFSGRISGPYKIKESWEEQFIYLVDASGNLSLRIFSIFTDPMPKKVDAGETLFRISEKTLVEHRFAIPEASRAQIVLALTNEEGEYHPMTFNDLLRDETGRLVRLKN